MPRAASLAAEIADTFALKPELVRDKGGVFDVHVDGQLIFSKHTAHRFPENHEILDALAKLRGG